MGGSLKIAMENPKSKQSRFKQWYREIVEPQHLEAPNKHFKGHRDIITRNLARYQFVRPFVQGRTLEVGCGRGYGLEIIGSHCTQWVGLDVSALFLSEAQRTWPQKDFILADGVALPFASHTFDTVIAFEVIEHVQDDRGFLSGLKRVANSQGRIIVSTPNRWVSSGHATRPLDRFHVREYTASEFKALLSEFFDDVKMYGQVENKRRKTFTERLLDRIPVRWKYILPAHIQGYLSIMLRKPLNIEECQFIRENLDEASNLLAICSGH